MARINRADLAVYGYFHICSIGNNKQSIFCDRKDRLRYLGLLEKYLKLNRIQCYAYCLMTNHIHLLLLSPKIKLLSRAIHAAHTGYAAWFNKKHGRTGHLFENRFSSWVIRGDDHLLRTKDYIENNPVKAGLVKVKSEYEWSSARGDEPRVTLYKI